jgi:glycosyltransferase involved in cell wall biosynthesis
VGAVRGNFVLVLSGRGLDSTMRIAYLAKTRVPDIAANSMQSVQVCAALAGLGHAVTFIVIDDSGACNEPTWEQLSDFYDVQTWFKVEKIAVPKAKNSRLLYLWASLVSIPRIRKKLIKGRYDLVYSRDVLSAWIASHCRFNTVFEAHALIWTGRLQRLLFARLVRSKYLLKLVSITHSLAEVYIRRYPELQDRVIIAPDGAEICSQRVIENAESPLKGLPTKLKVGYVGHLYKGKGLEVVEAIAGSMPDVEFHIVGGRPEDVSFWEHRIKEDNVFFYGFVPREKLSHYYAALDVCILPNQETVWAAGAATVKNRLDIGSFTSPLKMFEYMAHGKAIVASDLPVLREVLHDGIAVLVDASRAEEWKDAIRFFANATERDRFGLAAREEFLKRYTWDIRSKKILQSIAET